MRDVKRIAWRGKLSLHETTRQIHELMLDGKQRTRQNFFEEVESSKSTIQLAARALIDAGVLLPVDTGAPEPGKDRKQVFVIKECGASRVVQATRRPTPVHKPGIQTTWRTPQAWHKRNH